MTPKSSQLEHLKLVTDFIAKPCCKHTIAGPGGPVRYETWTRTKRLGEGGFGVVYQETCSERRSDIRGVKQISNSILRWDEVGILAQLRSDTEHFVQLTGWFEDEYDIYLAMEYLPGDLGGLLEERNRGLCENELKSVTKQILAGLKILHKMAICHRDLKPGNILISNWVPLRIKIGDFGVSKLKHPDSNTEWPTTAVTRAFMAPEIQDFSDQESSEYSTAVDIWSLGCLVYFMITKTLPFPQTKSLKDYLYKQSLFPPRTAVARTIPDSGFAGTIPDSAAGFIARLLQPLPENRPSASRALLHSWLLIQERFDETIWMNTLSDASKLVSAPGPKQRVSTVSDPALAAKGKSAAKDKAGQRNTQVSATPWSKSKITYIQHNYLTDFGIRELTEVPEALQYLLVAAATSGNCELLIQQLRKGARPMEDPSGYTPIHTAAKNDHLSIIKVLLGHGAHLGVGGTRGVSALHGAASGGNLQIVEYLLDKGADISATNNDGCMAHHIAAQFGATEVLQLLVERGADISARGVASPGWTALMYAAREGRLGTARYLLERGDISEEGLDNTSGALKLAAKDGHVDMVRLLLERGASTSVRNAGEEAISLAAHPGHTEIVILICEWFKNDMSISFTELDNFNLSIEDSTQTTSEGWSTRLRDSRAYVSESSFSRHSNSDFSRI